MGMFLNSRIPFDSYKATVSEKYFVDKTMLITELIPALGTSQRFLCITRPRRFGKSVMANMVAAFFGKSADAGIFNGLKIASQEAKKALLRASCGNYHDYLNQYDVIYIDFSQMPESCNSYTAYINRFSQELKKDLLEAFPESDMNFEYPLWDILSNIYQKTGRRFLFVIDEWDAVFHMDFITESDKKSFLLFLKSLLKDKIYAELVYMTGILPIAKYSDGSELNMFVEYNMATAERFSSYFGFSNLEVDRLYAVYRQTTENVSLTRDDLRIWYDGYYTAGGERLYNPRSIVCALTDNQLRNYWTSSGVYDSVFGYIKDNTADILDDLTLLFAGNRIPSDIQEYAATSLRHETKDEIYSALVVYGLLTYKDGTVSIPNRELTDSFASMMKKEKSLGYIYKLANISKRMLSATLAGKTDEMAEILAFAHNTESPIFDYNSEIELSSIVNLAYLSARDCYRVEREEKAGEGYVDFIFYPDNKQADAEPKYTGRLLAVGISYDRKRKVHFCKVEVLK